MAEALVNPVAQKLKTTGDRLGAIVCLDGPNDEAQLKSFRAANGNERVYITSPTLKIPKNGDFVNVPSSAFAAGIFAAIDFWRSPSNQEVNGAVGTTVPISFALDDPTSQGQKLNSFEVATFVRQDGLRLWGARGSGVQTDLTTNQIQKIRIREAIREAIIASHRWAVAMGITSNLFQAVASSVSAYLEDLAQKGAIAGGKCTPDTEQNTPTNLNDGKVFWIYEHTPTPVAETLTFTEILTDKYLAGIGAA
ncbi:MAG: phage tail sheath subtilisin-like domain-containing protein [Pseudobdellovibrionaceae bacterium]|nr:phage tail sheath subtilisin-like domain-containing protein [Pseudobdellovibrionaceae bacterium]